MPPLDPRARYPEGMQRIAIPTLSGGVGRQAPTKRAVNEAENIDNALASLERSVEKRSPTTFIRRYTDETWTTLDDSNTYATLGLPNESPDADYYFDWFQISDEQRYLVAIDYQAADKFNLIRIYRTSVDGFYECSTDLLSITDDMFDYFTYGNDNPANKANDVFKSITIGPQLILLNSVVEAGYTSDELTLEDGEEYYDAQGVETIASGETKIWARVGYDGDFIRDEDELPYEDLLGRKLTYFTSTPVDPEGQASIYVPSKFYIQNDQVFALVPEDTDMADYGYNPDPAGDGSEPSTNPDLNGYVTGTLLSNDMVLIFTCTKDGPAEQEEGVPAPTPVPSDNPYSNEENCTFALRSEEDGGCIAKFIAVEDWDYPEASKAYLGGQLEDFSEFKFPPNASDLSDNAEGSPDINLNNPAVVMTGKVSSTLDALYEDTNGEGKIYNVTNSYAGEPPGFYIVKNADEKPYVRLIRSPYEYSVLDKIRFPKILSITNIDKDDNNKETFGLNHFTLEERRSGNLTTNPGPSCFKDGRQGQIKSVAFFRDRLFLSVGDDVFSSRIGDFSDFWTENPSLVVDTDPIDIRLSTNKYAPVSTMTPFQQYLFINTGSDIQFTLSGSENTITPANAVVSPTAFYSTAPLIDPVLLGSQIYFFAPRRAYVYFNDATVSINQAVEVSLHCPDYLPENWGKVSIIPGYDSMAMLDGDNPKFVYMYTNRYSGAEVAQNAFFRYIYDTDVKYVESFDNGMFFVMRYEYLEEGETVYRYYLEHQKFREPDYATPLIDHQVEADESNMSYDSNENETTITVPYYANLNVDTLYIKVNELDELSGTSYELADDNEDSSVVSVQNVDGTVAIVLKGDYTTEEGYREIILGTSYTMVIELSPQYVRDERNNAVEGITSLRTLALQHFNSGQYRVEKIIRGRRSTTMSFSPAELDEGQVTGGFDVPLPLYERKGETFSKIMGYAAETSIEIISDYPAPVNITQIELKGRFTGKSSGFVR